jgi:hypothetical protein
MKTIRLYFLWATLGYSLSEITKLVGWPEDAMKKELRRLHLKRRPRAHFSDRPLSEARRELRSMVREYTLEWWRVDRAQSLKRQLKHIEAQAKVRKRPE